MQFPRLNLQQLDRLSEIFGNLGLVFFASFVIPIFSPGAILKSPTVLSGLFISFGFIALSLRIIEGGDKP